MKHTSDILDICNVRNKEMNTIRTHTGHYKRVKDDTTIRIKKGKEVLINSAIAENIGCIAEM